MRAKILIMYVLCQILSVPIINYVWNIIMSIEPTIDIMILANKIKLIVLIYHLLMVSFMFMYIDMRYRHYTLNKEYSDALLENMEE